MNRSLQYLLIIFGALLLLFFINQNQQSKYRISSQAIFEVDENDIHRFSMVDSNGDSLVLAKSDSSWYIPEADTLEMKDRQINQFFEKVVNGTFYMIMSKNTEKWDKFGVADSSGKKVTLYDVNNKSLASVIFKSNSFKDK